jgi:hypothetical protein
MVEIGRQRLCGELFVEHHPEGDQTTTDRPVGLHHDEGLDQEAVIGNAALAVLPAVEVGHERAQLLGGVEHDPPDTVALLSCQAFHVLAQRGLETPLGPLAEPTATAGYCCAG